MEVMGDKDSAKFPFHAELCPLGSWEWACLKQGDSRSPWEDYVWAMVTQHNCKILHVCIITRADFRFVLDQWEMPLLCNDVSHWLGANLESALIKYM